MPIHRPLIRLLGIPITINADSWQFVVTRLVTCMIVAAIASPAQGVLPTAAHGLLYAALLMLVQVFHTIGHIVGGLAVGHPMDEGLIGPNHIMTLYHDQPADLSRRVHLGRTIAGPLMNITLGVGAALLVMQSGGHALRFFAAANLLIALLTLLPIRTLDGEILWNLAPRQS